MFNKFNRIGLLAGVLLLGGSALCAQEKTGTAAGTVFNAQTGRPIAGVVITVDGTLDLANQTDADGNFVIRTAPGEHTLGFTADGYRTEEMTIDIVAGEVAQASTLMSSADAVTTIDVVETLDAVTATAEAMLMERKLAPVVSDSMSREELSQGTAGDAAAALTKVTGISVMNNGYVFVRGLGERYSATSLNGATIPTTEPEKRVVPLDLFPSSVIDNIKVAKTYSPDLPAEFSGGMVQLQTMSQPVGPTFNMSYKGGFNTKTSFQPFMTYPGAGGIADFFGFGAGSRGLPSAIGPDVRLFQGQFSRQELATLGQSFPDIWEPTPVASQRPASDWSMNGGNTFGKWGIVGGMSFSNKPQVINQLQRFLRVGSNGPRIYTEYPHLIQYVENARLGGVLNLSYKANANNKVAFHNTFTNDADKYARTFSGYNGFTDTNVSDQRLRYIQRSVYSSDIQGEHILNDWKGAILNWQFTFARSARNEPDMREVVRTLRADGSYSFASLSNSGMRFFTDLTDHIFEPKADLSIPFFKGAISGMFKIGGRYTERTRVFQARRFRYIPQQRSTLDLLLPSNQLFAPSNIRPTGFQITEFTRGTDHYNADMKVLGAYAMVDLSLGLKWRIVGGLRVEDADQEVVTVDNSVPNQVPIIASLRNRDPIPSLNIIYSVNQKHNLRWGYSRTLSRPDFRELSPFDFINVLGGWVTVGNPNLKRAAINNYDVRWEYFPGGNQLVAASFFYKDFSNPIESTIIPSTDLRQSFVNAQGAHNFGFELELRQGLGNVHHLLNEFALNSNFTFVNSNIVLYPAQAAILTTSSRPMMGQARYVFNGGVQWARPKWNSNAQFTSNYVSSKITDVGTFGLPNIVQQGNILLNFAYQYSVGERGQWQYKLEAENLADNEYQWVQGPFTQQSYHLGRTFQVGLSYSFF